MLYSLLNAIEANEAVESAHGCQVPVYGLKIVRIATSWNEEGKLQKSRRGDWRRQGRGMVGMAGGRGGAASLVVGKVEGREVFHHRPGFLLVHYSLYPVHTFTRTHISLPALATLNLNLQTRIAPSPSSLTSLYVQRKALLWKSMPRLLFVAQKLFVFEKRELSFYIYFAERNFKHWIFFERTWKEFTWRRG